MLQGLQAGGGKGIAGGYGDEGIRAVPTHLAGLLHLQGARGMGAGCHKLRSHVQGGDIRAGVGASPFGLRGSCWSQTRGILAARGLFCDNLGQQSHQGLWGEAGSLWPWADLGQRMWVSPTSSIPVLGHLPHQPQCPTGKGLEPMNPLSPAGSLSPWFYCTSRPGHPLPSVTSRSLQHIKSPRAARAKLPLLHYSAVSIRHPRENQAPHQKIIKAML